MKSKNLSKKQALESIKIFFNKAEIAFGRNPSLADRHIKSARRLSMKFKVKLPLELKRRFCRHCYAYLKPGKNCRIRVQRGRVIYYCLICKRFTRRGYKS